MSDVDKKARAVMASAKVALAEGFEQVGSFTNAKKFKDSLVKALDLHPGFKNAVQDFHDHAVSQGRSVRDQTPRQIVPSGRVQAPRRDTPKGRP